MHERRFRQVSEPAWVATAAAVVAAVVIAALEAISSTTSFSMLFVLVPVIASAAASPRATAALGALTVAVGAGFLTIEDVSESERLVRVIALALGAALATGLAVNRARREQRLEDLDRFATIAQSLIIRPVPARLASVAAAGRYISASKVVAVGGDLYDVALTPAGVRFIIGDACGKGLGGVRLAAELLTSFREAVFGEPNLAALAIDLDRRVIEVCLREARELDFVTAVIGELRDDGELHVVSCGHPDGLLITRTGERIPLAPSCRAYPLGLGAQPVVETFHVSVGDRAIWWTDGASEARDERGDFLDVEDAIAACVDGRSLAGSLDAVVAAVLQHAHGDVRDDVALLGLERLVPAPAGSWPGAARAV